MADQAKHCCTHSSMECETTDEPAWECPSCAAEYERECARDNELALQQYLLEVEL